MVVGRPVVGHSGIDPILVDIWISRNQFGAPVNSPVHYQDTSDSPGLAMPSPFPLPRKNNEVSMPAEATGNDLPSAITNS